MATREPCGVKFMKENPKRVRRLVQTDSCGDENCIHGRSAERRRVRSVRHASRVTRDTHYYSYSPPLIQDIPVIPSETHLRNAFVTYPPPTSRAHLSPNSQFLRTVTIDSTLRAASPLMDYKMLIEPVDVYPNPSVAGNFLWRYRERGNLRANFAT